MGASPVPAVAAGACVSCSLFSAVLLFAGSLATNDVLQAEGEALVELGECPPGLLILDPWPAAACVQNGG